MHTILGAGGAVSPDLASILTANNIPVQQVSRSGKTFEHGIAKAADLMDPKGALSAVHGSEVAYLTVGLPYSLKVWAQQWKPLMHNVVNACIQTGTKLILLDNIYGQRQQYSAYHRRCFDECLLQKRKDQGGS